MRFPAAQAADILSAFAMLIDAHNHLQDPRFGSDLPTVIAAMRRQQIEHCIVNGTSEDDWDAVAALQKQQPDLISPAYGLHPWKLKTRSGEWLERLRHHLTNSRSSIGECGLDLWLRDADIDDQISVFRQHLQLSRDTGKPLTVHCLKAWPQLLALLEESPPIPPFFLHSFSGPAHLIKSLCRKGAHFSFSGYFLHPRKHKALQTFRLIPAERLHGETDAPDMTAPDEFRGEFANTSYHHPADLPYTLAALAELRGITPQECSEQCRLNSRDFFAIPD